MPSTTTAPSVPVATPLLRQWRSMTRLPMGSAVFSRAVGLRVPYAGTVRPKVLDLQPGHARILMADRRGVRNHLQSIHAVALVNLGEMAANMALMTLQPKNARWIVTGIEAEYLKKARGPIVALCHLDPELDWTRDASLSGEATLTDDSGDPVARLRQHWKIGPRRSRSGSESQSQNQPHAKG